jgi:hypothetical protein
MLTAAECLTKSEEMTEQAAHCGDPALGEVLNEMAYAWQKLAIMAHAQDHPSYLL